MDLHVWLPEQVALAQEPEQRVEGDVFRAVRVPRPAHPDQRKGAEHSLQSGSHGAALPHLEVLQGEGNGVAEAEALGRVESPTKMQADDCGRRLIL